MNDKSDLDSMRDCVVAEVRRVAALWFWLQALQDGSTSTSRLRRLETIISNDLAEIGDARSWRLTVEIIMTRVDRTIGTREACRAMFARVLFNVPYDLLAERLRTSRLTVKNEIIPAAIAHFYAELVQRGISDQYREQVAC